VHYDPPKGDGWWSRFSFYASVQNLFDKTYVGSASVISDTLNPVATLSDTSGSIYAGIPRTAYVGMRARF
jgi:iron complex outermembrane receptor protein